MAKNDDVQRQVDDNYEAFKKLFPTFPVTYAGKYVLLRDGEVENVFDTARDALIFARAQFPDRLFSIQEVTDQVTDLGYFSHAMHIVSVRPENRTDD